MIPGTLARCLACVTVLSIVACSNDKSYGEPVPASVEAEARATREKMRRDREAAASARPFVDASSAPPPESSPRPDASARPPGPAWPRGSVCGIEARDVTALGDPVQWRTIAVEGRSTTLTEWSRDVTRTADDLRGAGFAPAGGSTADSFTRRDAGRDLAATLFPKGRAKLVTQCEIGGATTTAAAERAGWITAYVHRRIGRGTLATFTANDGDERYVRVQLDAVEGRPDTSGLVEVAKGAYRNEPSADPEALIVLGESPLTVEYHSGNELLVKMAMEMHTK